MIEKIVEDECEMFVRCCGHVDRVLVVTVIDQSRASEHEDVSVYDSDFLQQLTQDLGYVTYGHPGEICMGESDLTSSLNKSPNPTIPFYGQRIVEKTLVVVHS
ncbi:uncharacterized protein LOC120078189 [Benincasa hispida]|uniref:uncharacterized protein LOC120078189 n=1 Tax=Benincasa hispida TaxID=102211 RepID=UPI0019008C7A|nr:uncharacterized protein LOC120078189 [Benincasa hispida]